ncbi:hypothetical protein F4694_002618 [Bacillus niacini]|uniref:Uncharacterized protein n=1 Tax=Neobacillus niacini TaxID=86668 RepID=A0A852TAQ6_9BACI|nr:hypothetical protein [Neobacillus niacini]
MYRRWLVSISRAYSRCRVPIPIRTGTWWTCSASFQSGKIAMAQGTTADISIAKHARKGSTDINEKLQQAMKNVHTVRQNAAIQFNPELANGRRKIYELWDNLYGNEQDTIQKIR